MDPSNRYSRQVKFPGIGVEGQRKLRDATAVLVGVGALGSWLAEILVRAGVGRLFLADRDVVELSNLQRQLLYTEADVERPKALAAAEHLAQINSEVELIPLAEDFGPQQFDGLGTVPNLILDGTDNFATRYLLNDLAMRHSIPWIYGGTVGAKGTAMAILPGVTPCFRCIMPQPPSTGESATCETAGVLAPAVATVSAFQAAQALKILSGNPGAVTRGILVVDVWHHEYSLRMAHAGPAPSCRTCRGEEFPALAAEWSQSVSLCGRDAVQVQPRASAAVDLTHLAHNLRDVASDISPSEHLLRFAAEGCRFSVFPGGRAILFGIADQDRARVLYDRYVGA